MQALSQVNTPRFPGTAYLVAMVRRVLIDRKLPQEWLDTAPAVQRQRSTIDMGKLRFLAEGVSRWTASYFTLPALKERYEIEVQPRQLGRRGHRGAGLPRRLPGPRRRLGRPQLHRRLAQPPREVRQGQATGTSRPAIVAQPGAGPRPRTKRHPPDAANLGHGQEEAARHAHHRGPGRPAVHRPGSPARGQRVLVRGRLWGVSGQHPARGAARRAPLRGPRLVSKGALLAEPANVAACPVAINELTGTAPAPAGRLRALAPGYRPTRRGRNDPVRLRGAVGRARMGGLRTTSWHGGCSAAPHPHGRSGHEGGAPRAFQFTSPR